MTQSMNPGAKLGPYEIVAAIGAGGMGEVYRARDTRLDRTVAIKILPAGVAATPEARQRFEREARAISALNHPNICTLYDVGQQDGTDFLVMEFLEGESLAQRLVRGALPLDQVFRYGREIAEALGRAHRAGVIHRDLKPGNIMLTKSGAKLLDFGLAKATQQPVQMDLSTSPTLLGSAQTILATTPAATSPLTAQGSIVGTFQYMSPEQLEGKEADARSDIFAFGAVLYEMVTGAKAFAATSQASLIAAILTSEPRPVSEIQSANPAALDRLIRTCLAKDPDQRWQSADDIARELQWIAQGGSQTGAPAVITQAAQKKSPRGWQVAGLTAFIVAAVTSFLLLNQPKPSTPIVTSGLSLPGDFQLDTYNRDLALSPDGSRLAIAGNGADGHVKLWMRTLSSSDVRPIDGTDGGTYPFWSPDSKFLGFFADHKLKKYELATGSVTTICPVEDSRGGSWSDDGEIAFSAGSVGPLYIVDSGGGDPVALTQTKGFETNRLPLFLPGGQKCLFTAGETTKAIAQIYVVDLKTHEKTLLLNESSDSVLTRNGPDGNYYLLFKRGATLLAQEFDPAAPRLLKSPVTLAENVDQYQPRYSGQYAASNTGLLVYAQAEARIPSELHWIDSDGKSGAAIGDPRFIGEIVLSPDARSAALTIHDDAGRNDVWISNLATGNVARFTSGGLGSQTPAWTPDGKSIVYQDVETGVVEIKQAAGIASARELTRVSNSFGIFNVVPDGSAVLIAMVGAKGHGAIWTVALPNGGDPKLLLPKSPDYSTTGGGVSPDGKWIAYFSNQTGSVTQLFVSPYPSVQGSAQGSTNGATWNKWVNHGSQIIFVQPSDGKLFSVDFTAKNGNVELGQPRPIFGGYGLSTDAFDISPDGKRLLVAAPIRSSGNQDLTLVSNWTALLHK